MSIQHFTAEGRTTINWASGTSTELFIHPSDGSFADRNFLFRISTATVEAEESTFTFFQGITRHLMILKGELELMHEGRYTKYLKPYDQDTFSGEWSTRSRGKVTDFNLMLKEGATGSLEHQHVVSGSSISIKGQTDYYFIFLASGKLVLSNGNEVAKTDLLWISKDADISATALEESDLVAIKAAVINKT